MRSSPVDGNISREALSSSSWPVFCCNLVKCCAVIWWPEWDSSLLAVKGVGIYRNFHEGLKCPSMIEGVVVKFEKF